MATEAQRAPRVACGRTSMAAVFAAAQEAGAPIAADFPADEARSILTELIALTELLSAAFDDCGRRPTGVAGEIMLRVPSAYGRAFDGLQRMARLADFHVACSMGDAA